MNLQVDRSSAAVEVASVATAPAERHVEQHTFRHRGFRRRLPVSLSYLWVWIVRVSLLLLCALPDSEYRLEEGRLDLIYFCPGFSWI
jgi:hypothetical protein